MATGEAARQWPAGHVFLASTGGYTISTLNAKSPEAVVPVDSRLAAIIFGAQVSIAGSGGIGTTQTLTRNGSVGGPTYRVPEGTLINEGLTIDPENEDNTEASEPILLEGDRIQMNSDGLQIGVTTARVIFVLKPI